MKDNTVDLNSKGKVYIAGSVLVLATLAFFMLAQSQMLMRTTVNSDPAALSDYVFWAGLNQWGSIFVMIVCVLMIIVGVMYRAKSATVAKGIDKSHSWLWRNLN